MSRRHAFALAALLAFCGAGSPAAAEEGGVETCSDVPGAERVVALLNALRSAGAPCARPGSPPLRWDESLSSSAQAQASDLAVRDKLSHLDAQQRPLAVRLQAAGYRLVSAAENLAAGQPDLEAALLAWATSPAHCSNLMQERFSQVGLACVQRSGSVYGRFWVAHFGAPRRR